MPQVMDRRHTAESTTGRRGWAAFGWALGIGLSAVVGAGALSAANHDGVAMVVLVAGVLAGLLPAVRGSRGGVDRKGLAGAAGGLLVVALLVAAAIGYFFYLWSKAS